MRPDGRANDEMRQVRLTRGYTCHAEGSVLAEFGRTRVICNATFENSVPHFLKGGNQGWVTAEYGMLPRSTNKRMRREAGQGRQSGRTFEIQRLIGRSLRAVVDLEALGENSIIVDCDVLQADGGTRTAAVTGACVALADACDALLRQGLIRRNPVSAAVAAVSVGVCAGDAVLDLDYAEDSTAATDMNVVMNDRGEFIEVQGCAEGRPFTLAQLEQMLALARGGIEQLFRLQQAAPVAAQPVATSTGGAPGGET